MKTMFFVCAWLIFAIPCSADIIAVDPNGTGDYTTIQASIKNANDFEGPYFLPAVREQKGPATFRTRNFLKKDGCAVYTGEKMK